MPFGYDKEYKDWDDCISKNKDRDNPDSYCGWLKSKTEGSLKTARKDWSFKTLLEGTGKLPYKHLAKSRVRGVRTRKNQRRFIYHVTSTEPYSDPRGHLVSFVYPNVKGDIGNLLKGDVKGGPYKTRVRVRCSCPAWQYWGSAYNSTDQKYRLFTSPKENRSPNIRDPGKENLVCKHVIRVGRRVKGMTFKGLLVAFNIDKGTWVDWISDWIRPVFGRYMEEQGMESDVATAMAEKLDPDNWEDIAAEYGLLVDEDLD